MKKSFILVFLMGLLITSYTGCKNNSVQDSVTTDSVVVDSVVIDSAVVDSAVVDSVITL